MCSGGVIYSGGELMCSGRVSSSYSTSGTRRVNIDINPVISHECGEDREVFATIGIYPWSFVTQIFHKGQPRHGAYGSFGSVASLLQQSSIKEILKGTISSGISYQLREIYSIFRCCLNVATYKYIVLTWKLNLMTWLHMIPSLFWVRTG
jgi:hypothetical protein